MERPSRVLAGRLHWEAFIVGKSKSCTPFRLRESIRDQSVYYPGGPIGWRWNVLHELSSR